MTFYYCWEEAGLVRVWIEDNGVDVEEGSGSSMAEATYSLLDMLSQRDDPKATPHIAFVEKKKK